MRRMTNGLAAACIVAAAASAALAQDKAKDDVAVEPKRVDAQWLVHRFDLGSPAFHVPGIDIQAESDCGDRERREIGRGTIVALGVSPGGERLVAIGGTSSNLVVTFDAASGRVLRSWHIGGAEPPAERRGKFGAYESGGDCIADLDGGRVVVLGWNHDNEFPPGHNSTVVYVLRDDDPVPTGSEVKGAAPFAELPGRPLSVCAADGDPGGCWIATTEAVFRGETAGPAPRFESVHAEPCARGNAFGRGALMRATDLGYLLVEQEGSKVAAQITAGSGRLLAVTRDGRWCADYDDGIDVGAVALRGRRIVRHFAMREPRPGEAPLEPWSCALSPDGAAVAWVTLVEHRGSSEPNEWTTDVFSVRTGERLVAIPPLGYAPGGLAFSGDGTVLLVTYGTLIRRFDLRSGKEIVPATGHLVPPYLVRVSGDGKLIVSVSGDRICTWSGGDGKAISVVNRSRDESVVDAAIRLDPSGPQIVALVRSADWTSLEIARWKVGDGSECGREAFDAGRPSRKFRPDGILSGDGLHVAGCNDEGMFVRDLAADGRVRIVEQRTSDRNVCPRFISADGTTIVFTSADDVLALKIAGNNVTKITCRPAGSRSTLDVLSADGVTAAGSAYDIDGVRVWDLDGRSAPQGFSGLRFPYGETVRSVGHGHHVVVTDYDRLMIVGSDAAEPPLVREATLRAYMTCASSLTHSDAFVTGFCDSTLAVWRIDWDAKPAPAKR